LSGIVVACLSVLLFGHPAPASAQLFASTPVTLGGGRIVIGGQAAVSMSAPADTAGFNDGYYAENSLRLARFAGSAEVHAGDRILIAADVQLLTDVDRSNWHFYPHRAVVQIRPAKSRALFIEAGILPPVFGGFLTRGYEANPLIGVPLAYQYPTDVGSRFTGEYIQAGSGGGGGGNGGVPPGYMVRQVVQADLQARLRGGSEGAPAPPRNSAGGFDFTVAAASAQTNGTSGQMLVSAPIVDALGWSPGVSVRAGSGKVRLSVAVANGTLSRPRSVVGASAREISPRLEIRPVVGLVIGASVARGSFNDTAFAYGTSASVTYASGRVTQTAVGTDVEYSRGYWLVRSEIIFNAWGVPAEPNGLAASSLRVTSFEAEGRYRLLPGVYAAARFDRLSFGSAQMASFPYGPAVPWDADLTRVEAGIGWSIERNLMLKGVYQYTRRASAPARTAHLVSAQLLFWF
jgi:hypothetical protein